jgi:hypothetical protein
MRHVLPHPYVVHAEAVALWYASNMLHGRKPRSSFPHAAALAFSSLLLASGCSLDTEGAGAGNTGGATLDASSDVTGGGGGTAGTGGSIPPPDASEDVSQDAQLDVDTDVGDATPPDVDAPVDSPEESDVILEAPLGDPGSPCNVPQDCASGFCADGVCCASACDQTCESCDTTGTCVPTPAGTDPDGECGSCQTCDGNFGCAACLPSQQCPQVSTDDCDRLQVCVECTSDIQCQSTTGRCEGCACVPKLDTGGPCDETTDCTSGKCGASFAASPLDCAQTDVCIECDSNTQCNGTTGRCDDCACVPKDLPLQPCKEATDCVSGRCGPGVAADANDCDKVGVCAECDADNQCNGSTGRCDGCLCIPKVLNTAPCNEATDCVSGKCGPGVAADPLNCDVQGSCAECDADNQCATGRCDGCACIPKLLANQPCDEASDCVNGRCGPSLNADPNDCATSGVCAECDADNQCGTGRCDGCACLQKLPKDAACDEPTDCVSGVCTGIGKCT